MFNMFSGGALEQLSIFALGIMPYISASIILQLLTVVVPDPRAPAEGRASRAAEDQPVHPLRHHPALDRAVYFIARWLESRRSRAAASYARCSRRAPRARLRAAHGVYADRRARRSSCGSASRSPSAASATASRSSSSPASSPRFPDAVDAPLDIAPARATRRVRPLSSWRIVVAVIAAVVFFERGSGGSRCSTPSASVGPKDVRRPVDAPAAQGQHRRRHPADLRFVDPALPGHARQLVQSPGCSSSADALQPGDWLYNSLYVGADHLLLLLLHGGDVQSRRRRRQHEEVRRLHPGHPARQGDRRVHRPACSRGSPSAARSTSRPSASCRRSCSRSSTCRSRSAARLLIVVGVALDTVQQIEGHLITRNYEGFTGPRDRAFAAGAASARVGPSGPPHEPTKPHPSRTAGRGQGHAGAAARRSLRHPADLDRRHAARRAARGTRSGKKAEKLHERRTARARPA